MHQLDGQILLDTLSRVFSIDIEVEAEEIIKYMVELSEYRARLATLYDYKGLPLLRAARKAVEEYIVVTSTLKIEKNFFNPIWFTLEQYKTECAYLFFEKDVQGDLAEFLYPHVQVGDFITLIILELASADHASGITEPAIIIKDSVDVPYRYIIPKFESMKKHEPVITSILDEEISLKEWTSRIKNNFIKLAKGRS